MKRWIDQLIKQCVPSHKQHVVFKDDDNLFQFNELEQEWRHLGFTIYRVHTNLELRLVSELSVRQSSTRCLVIFPELTNLLPDLEEVYHTEIFNFSHLVPNLSRVCLKGLSYSQFSRLYNLNQPSSLNEIQTTKYILEHLYQIDCDSLETNPSLERLIAVLLNIWSEPEEPNSSIISYLQNKSTELLKVLGINKLNKDLFIQSLQKQWELAILQQSSTINFTDSQLLKILPYSIASEQLHKISLNSQQLEKLPTPLHSLILIDDKSSIKEELITLIEKCRTAIEDDTQLEIDSWSFWVPLLAKAKRLTFQVNDPNLNAELLSIENSFNQQFQTLIESQYTSLFTRSSFSKPYTVSKILPHLSTKDDKKQALIVLDGLSYWQWSILEHSLKTLPISIKNQLTFSFIPSITAWSRQALFKGDYPDLSKTNKNEDKDFATFWSNMKVLPYQIQYTKFGVNNPLKINELSESITRLALVCNDLDDSLHGTIMGNEQLAQTTIQWLEKTELPNLIQNLLEQNFTIYLTTDHGNVEAVGIGTLSVSDKAGALSRSKRYVTFANQLLQKEMLSKYKQNQFGTMGLSVYCKYNQSFTTNNQNIITHGGSHFWEVAIPFITITK